MSLLRYFHSSHMLTIICIWMDIPIAYCSSPFESNCNGFSCTLIVILDTFKKCFVKLNYFSYQNCFLHILVFLSAVMYFGRMTFDVTRYLYIPSSAFWLFNFELSLCRVILRCDLDTKRFYNFFSILWIFVVILT